LKKEILNKENFRGLSGKANHTYLNGVLLALNAIPDAYLLLDGPPCGYDKVYFIDRTHDFFSDIIRRDSFHRVCNTNVRADHAIVEDRTEEISRLLLRVAKVKDCSVVFVSSLPAVTIIGIQYELILNKVQRQTSVPLIEVRSKSLQGDWLDGYEETLFSLAKEMRLKESRKKGNNIAIVGYLFDRNEGDHFGNLSEIKRLLGELSLNLVSVWLSGCSFNRLYDIERAQTIVSLPYGRRAAREIASKTKADLIELNLPFGIQNTNDWIHTIARRLGKIRKSKSLINKELKETIPTISLAVSKYLIGRNFSFYGDPYLSYAATSSLTELGIKIEHAIIFGTQRSNKNLTSYRELPFKTIYEPEYPEISELDMNNIDLCIGNSHMLNLLRARNNKKPFIEFGYPSFYYHCLTPYPFLGYRGFLNFLNRIVNNVFYIY